MNGVLLWVLLGLGLLVLTVRRRSIAVVAVTAQALILVVFAFEEADSTGERLSAVALVARAVALAGFLILLITRTRESRPVRAGVAPLRRAGLGVALALALSWLVPMAGLGSPDTGRAVLALVAFGLVSWLIEIGVAFDLMLVALVAGVFHEKIFAEFGAGDAGALRSLRD
jgi:hypothetical protein